MDLAFRLTKRSIEGTARAVVDQLLGRGFAASEGAASAEAAARADYLGGGDTAGEAPPPPPLSSPPPSASPSISPEEFRARAEALVLIGGKFSGERPHRTVDKAVVGLNQLASHASVAKDQAGVLAGVAAAKASSFLGGLLAKKGKDSPAVGGGASGSSSPPPPLPPPPPDGPPPEPPANLGAFFTAFVTPQAPGGVVGRPTTLADGRV